MATQGIIWKIDRFATHDGPGVRTALYFKGCPLRCQWCSNPEGQKSEPVLVFQKTKCDGCGLCLEACSAHALVLRDTREGSVGAIETDRSKCDMCGVCVSACPTNALEIWGKAYSVADLLKILNQDRFIHGVSGGGLTCTGGEPLCQWDFVCELLEACKKWGIHTAVETCAYADEETFRTILQRVDWLFIDLKHMDARAHQMLTGRSNKRILQNARLASCILQARSKALVIRQVVIPGFTDGQNICDLADFLCSLPFITKVELLPYHNYGAYRYELLGRSYSLTEVTPPPSGAVERYKETLEARGLVIA